MTEMQEIKDIEQSTSDDENNSFINKDTNKTKEKDKQIEEKDNNFVSKDSKEIFLKNENTDDNNIFNEIDSNSPLINNKTPNRFFGLKLYLNNDVCFKFFKNDKNW